MNDDQMDEMLIQGVRDYNQPGSVPRDEMWAAVREARMAKSEAQAKTPHRSSLIAHRAWPIAIAAALVLGVGIVIGRRMERTSPSVATTVAVGAKANTPAANKPTADSAAPKRDTLIEQLREETARTGQRAQQLASAEPSAETSPRARYDQNLAYRLVVLRHLAGSEAMIASFRSGARSGEVDTAMAKWSRDLLATTRLLESSRASQDPVMKRLLDDLDLVISQIVQYTTKGTTNSEELEMIERTINKRGVMDELRSTIPADVRRGT